jgi:hypothetical protein
MNEWQQTMLLGCQTMKSWDQNGRQETREFMNQQLKESKRPFAVDFIKEKGISCTHAEMKDYEALDTNDILKAKQEAEQ